MNSIQRVLMATQAGIVRVDGELPGLLLKSLHHCGL
jgi:hypothetical protein